LLEVGVIGSAGVGKSCLINAVLGCPDLLPNSPGAYSVTHMLTEISSFDSNCYTVRISHFSFDELVQYVQALFTTEEKELKEVRE
jgi:hypothetical protein